MDYFIVNWGKQCLGLLLLVVILPACGTQDSPESPKPPNIVLIISDDQAWSDYGFTGHEAIETPRLDRLAAESLTFTRGYVSAPLCCPSLATIMTGMYPHQHGVTGNDPAFTFDGPRNGEERNVERHARFAPLIRAYNELPLLTSRLKALNYLSIQTGKWWMGSWEDSHFTHGMTHGDPTRGGRHGDEGLTIGREGLEPIFDFIHTADSLDRPFFVWYAPFLPHAPHTPPPELEAKYLERAPTPAVARYWAMCEWFDQTCGALLDHLDEQQLTEETLIIYVCDNGWIQDPDRPNRYAGRSKQTPYEGGIRTPLMFKWPGKITAALDTTTLAGSIDIVPTILAACALPADEQLPGVSILDRKALQGRTTLFAEDYAHDIQNIEQPTLSLEYRVALNYPWKLILPDNKNMPDVPAELFNIAEDPFERHELSDTHPGEVDRLRKLINEWWVPEHMQERGGADNKTEM